MRRNEVNLRHEVISGVSDAPETSIYSLIFILGFKRMVQGVIRTVTNESRAQNFYMTSVLLAKNPITSRKLELLLRV